MLAETAIHGQFYELCVCCRLEFHPLTSLPVTLPDLGKFHVKCGFGTL